MRHFKPVLLCFALQYSSSVAVFRGSVAVFRGCAAAGPLVFLRRRRWSLVDSFCEARGMHT